MTPSSPDFESAVHALLTSTETLEQALAGGEAPLDDALAARSRAFETLRECVPAPLSPTAHAQLERILQIDRGLATRADAQLAEVRTELARSRRSRGALKSLETATKPARFLSERA